MRSREGAKPGNHDCRPQAGSGFDFCDDSMAAALISPDGGQAHAPRGQRMDEDAWPGVKTGAVR